MVKIRYYLRFFGAVFFVLFDLTVKSFLKTKPNLSKNPQGTKNYRYGFVFTSDIGDVVIFSMFLLVFSKRIDSHCVLITSDANARLIGPFFPEVDFLVVDYSKYKTNLIYRFEKIREIARVFIDCCVVPMRSRDYIVTDSVARMLNRKNTITFSSDDSNRNNFETYIERFVYDEYMESFSAASHELITYQALSKKFGLDFQMELGRLISSYREKAREQTSIPRLDAPLPKTYVLMNIGASQVYKRWPVEKYVSLAEKIFAEFGFPSIFIGGPSEKDLQGSFGSYPFIVDLISKTESFELLRWLVVNARMVVSNDTFVGHYAVTLGVPTVSIAGGGHFGRFLPYPKEMFPMFVNSCTIFKRMPCFNCKWICTQITGKQTNRYFPCVSEIGMEDVFSALKTQASKN